MTVFVASCTGPGKLRVVRDLKQYRSVRHWFGIVEFTTLVRRDRRVTNLRTSRAEAIGAAP
jgi:hypothetical protein